MVQGNQSGPAGATLPHGRSRNAMARIAEELRTLGAVVVAAGLAFGVPAIAQHPAARVGSGAQVVVVEPDSRMPLGNAGASSNLNILSPFDLGRAEQVAALLANDPALTGASLRVVGRDGNITLLGTTVDSAQAARARQLAESVVGVGHADTRITAQQP
jgi:hypothetical protein